MGAHVTSRGCQERLTWGATWGARATHVPAKMKVARGGHVSVI